MSSYQFKKYRRAKITSNVLKAIEKKYRKVSKGDLNTVNISLYNMHKPKIGQIGESHQRNRDLF